MSSSAENDGVLQVQDFGEGEPPELLRLVGPLGAVDDREGEGVIEPGIALPETAEILVGFFLGVQLQLGSDALSVGVLSEFPSPSLVNVRIKSFPRPLFSSCRTIASQRL